MGVPGVKLQGKVAGGLWNDKICKGPLRAWPDLLGPWTNFCGLMKTLPRSARVPLRGPADLTGDRNKYRTCETATRKNNKGP